MQRKTSNFVKCNTECGFDCPAYQRLIVLTTPHFAHLITNIIRMQCETVKHIGQYKLRFILEVMHNLLFIILIIYNGLELLIIQISDLDHTQSILPDY